MFIRSGSKTGMFNMHFPTVITQNYRMWKCFCEGYNREKSILPVNSWSNDLITTYWPKQQAKKIHFSKSTSFYSLPINSPSGNICNLKSMKYHLIQINFSNFECTERVNQATCNTHKSYELFHVLLIMRNFQTPEHCNSVKIYVLPDLCTRTSQVQKKNPTRKVPAASSKASSLACVSGSTVLKSAPSAALDKNNSDVVLSTGLSRSSWSKINDSTCLPS